MYDGAIGRWYIIDQFLENYVNISPYAYSLNNPIRFIDPEGNTPQDVTRKAREYCGTWYEMGGKNPYYIRGYGVPPTVGWGVGLMADKNYDMGNLFSRREKKDFYYPISQTEIYRDNFFPVPNGYSLGIDCSGLTALAFNSDPDKCMNNLPEGANNQMEEFKKAQKNGTGSLHKDFCQLQEGDLVFRLVKNGQAVHVMVATGNVKYDKYNNVISIEVISAPGWGQQVSVHDIDVDDMMRIGHTKRDTNEANYESNQSGRPPFNFLQWVTQNNLWSKFIP